ncbi:glycosyltransferase family 2 protein [Zavarzinia sp.]|uniref:glycosyltransferase family 2 protein n=1 Tax=Zavarzinia sp. TaxID=2027920 RepID=UPI0035640675
MATDRDSPALTVIVPCYNEVAVIDDTAARLCALLDDLSGRGVIAPDSGILFVDDGSGDETWAAIERLGRRHPRCGGLKLSRNCGHQNALLAGLKASTTEITVSIDADLQDDTSAIERMIAAYREGAEIVYGVRDDRHEDSRFKRVSAELFYRLMQWLGVRLVFNHADFRLMSRRAIAALDRYTEVNLFLRALVPMLGFRTATVTYARGLRQAGESKYPFLRMVSFALTGITSFSLAPLRVITLTGFAVALLAGLVGLWALGASLIGAASAPGWASLLIVVSFLGGAQLFALGIVGEYVGRIYLETKRRPRFEVEAVMPPAAGAMREIRAPAEEAAPPPVSHSH